MNTKTHDGPISLERWTAAALLMALVATLVAVAGVAFRIPLLMGLIFALGIGAIACRWLARKLPAQWDGLHSRHQAWTLLWLLLAAAALARTAGVAWYMADATHPQASVYWFDHFYRAHSCFSGYWRAAELARAGVANLYDTAHYNDAIAHRFEVDEYLYVPQFLIMPRLGLMVSSDFFQLRAFWFAVEAALFLAAAIILCRWTGGVEGRRLALLLPALCLSTPILATLQVGNYQLAAVSLALIAMVCFDRDKAVIGGALLALAGFKLWPLLLIVYLAAARRWRGVAWTVAFSLAYCVMAYVWMGPMPFEGFLHYDWPRIVTRSAWSFADDLDVTSINYSVPGAVLKLKALGAKGMTGGLEDVAEKVWTLVVMLLAVLSAWRSAQMSRTQRACCWLSLLTLASFRTPFVPDFYGLIAPMWLWSMMAATTQLTRRSAVWLALLWLALNTVAPFDGTPLTGYNRLALSTVGQLVSISLCSWVLLRGVLRSRATQKRLILNYS
jgi:hypothetical protein